MVDFLSNYGLFLLKAITFVVAILFTFVAILALGKKQKTGLTITSLSDEWENNTQTLYKTIHGKKLKRQKKKDNKPFVFILDFNGDIRASKVNTLKDEITTILSLAKPEDEIMVRLESPGGSVNGYGLAAAQLERIRHTNIPLTICIDKVAASGGYLMASIANNIVAARFAIVGSIGVVSQIPNFHRFLKKRDIDVEVLTAGEYKRTLTILGENTEKGRQKFKEDLEKIHDAFRKYVLVYRDTVNIDEVATGEHWLAVDAQKFNLVDKLQTSDDWMLEKNKTHHIINVVIKEKQDFSNKFMKFFTQLTHPFA